MVCKSVTCYLLFQDIYLTLQAFNLYVFGTRWHIGVGVLQSLYRLSGLCGKETGNKYQYVEDAPVCVKVLWFRFALHRIAQFKG